MSACRPSHPICVAAVVCALWSAAGCGVVPKSLTPHWLQPADQRIAGRLQRPISINLTGQTLHRSLEWLRQTVGKDVRFHVNWPALREAGATADTAVYLRIGRTTTGEALRAVLQGVSTNYALNPIDYRVTGGMVLISTRADIYRTVNVHAIYNIRDIIVSLTDYRDLPGYRPPDAKGTPAAAPADTGHAAAVDQVIEVIRDSVGTYLDWEAGSIHEINGDLIVVTTPENQRQIKSLLKDLRKSRKKGRKNLRRERRGGWFSWLFG